MSTYAGRFGPEAIEYPDGGHAVLTGVRVFTKEGDMATLYADRDRAAIIANPVQTDALGNLKFYAEPGDYRITTSDISKAVDITVQEDPFEPDTGLTPEEMDILEQEVLTQLEPPIDLVVLFENGLE